MGQIDNLKNFEKGKSGNPNGRPKGSKNRSTSLKKMLGLKAQIINPASEDGEIMKGTVEDKMAAAMVQKALSGNLMAFREIMDCVYGKMPVIVKDPGETGDINKGKSTPFTIMNPVTNNIETFDIGGADE